MARRRHEHERTRGPTLTHAQRHLQDVATVQLGLALGLRVSWRTRGRRGRYVDPAAFFRDVVSINTCELPDDWQPMLELLPLVAETIPRERLRELREQVEARQLDAMRTEAQERLARWRAEDDADARARLATQ